MLERMWRKGGPCAQLVRMKIGVATVENSMAVSQETKNRTTIEPSNSTPRYLPKKTPKTLIRKRYMHPMSIVALFTIAKIWKQPKCPSTDQWIKKMWYLYTMDYYSAIKKDEILPFGTWVDLEGSMLRDISQRKTNTVWYHLYVESKK